MLLAMADGSKAHRYAAYGKCGACASTVRDSYLGRSAPRAVRVDDGMTRIGSPGIPRTKRRGELPAASDEQAATTIEAHSATCGNARRDDAEVSRRRSRQPRSRAAEGQNNETQGADDDDLERTADPARGRCAGGRHAPSLETRRRRSPRPDASGAGQRQPGAGMATGEVQQGSAGY